MVHNMVWGDQGGFFLVFIALIAAASAEHGTAAKFGPHCACRFHRD